MKIRCKNCVNWVDESLEQIEADHGAHPHIFMGCRIFGFIENHDAARDCDRYAASEDLFTLCSSCHIPVPKVCVSLGECANCTNTDLFCVDSCMGDENRKYCTHFVRLHTEGIHLIEKDRVFDLFPTLGIPGKERAPETAAPAGEKPKDGDPGENEPQNGDPSRMPPKK